MPWIFPFAESLLLPPGLFLLAIVIAIVLLWLKHRKAGFSLAIAGCVLLYLFSIVPVANLLVIPLENDYPPLARVDGADSVIVLGGGLVPVSPEEGGRPSLAAEGLKRLVYGARIAATAGLPLIVTGGTVPSRPASEPEAIVAKRAVEALGFKERSILLEGQSRNTWENAVRVEERFHPLLPTTCLAA